MNWLHAHRFPIASGSVTVEHSLGVGRSRDSAAWARHRGSGHPVISCGSAPSGKPPWKGDPERIQPGKCSEFLPSQCNW